MKRASKLIAAVAFVSLAASLAVAQEKKVKDQAEYDLFQSATQATDPAEKIKLLQTWKEKYPDSDFKNDRLVLIIQTYQQLGQGENMWSTAVDLYRAENKNETETLTANYYLTQLTASLNNTAADRLALGEEAAKNLLGLLPDTFSAAKKPPNVTDEAWKGESQKMEVLAHKTLAFIATSRQQWPALESELVTLLKMNPNSGQVSYQLGNAIVQQKVPERQVEAIYHFARAAYYEGEEELAPAVKTKVQDYFKSVWTAYTETEDGMKEFIELAKKSALPPGDLKIESGAERRVRLDNELRQQDPQKYLWIQVKNQLTSDGGSTYFNGQLKGSGMPRLKGTVVSATPTTRPSQVVVAVSDTTTPEITLRLDDRLRGDLRPGQTIEFDTAVPQEFTAQPFMLICDLDRERLTQN